MEIKIFDETLRTAQYLNTDQRTMLNERKETVSFLRQETILCVSTCVYTVFQMKRWYVAITVLRCVFRVITKSSG